MLESSDNEVRLLKFGTSKNLVTWILKKTEGGGKCLDRVNYASIHMF